MNSFAHPTPLPLDDSWPEIERALARHRNLVLVAEPGAGKTTRFPPRLLASPQMPADSRVLLLEPRRLAARASAYRIAEECGWTVGQEVGYQVRFENRIGPTTRLAILTEGLLARRLKSDPELRGVGAVILDEFHERSQHTDLALGLLYELQQLARPDLRIIVMSATLDAERVASYLGGCPQIKVPGRLFSIEVHHGRLPLALDTGPAFSGRVAEQALSLMENREPVAGDILVFLPGTREIRNVRERLESRARSLGYSCYELHGSLPLAEQELAIKKRAGEKKIVLATNIAETSLTLDGVGTVIDSGLARQVRVDAAGFERLVLSRISLASATQRAGRAGRQFAGHCYRLWSKLDEVSFPDFDTPELLRTNLSEVVLTLLSQNVLDPAAFSWFDPPPANELRSAQQTLVDLGFVDKKGGALTTAGRETLHLPLAPRLARLLAEARKMDRTDLGARLAGLLSERDIAGRAQDHKSQSRAESDVLLRLALLENSNSRHQHSHLWRVIDALKSSAERLRRDRLGAANPLLNPRDSDDEIALKLLLCAYPDRLCRRRRPSEPQARMIGGRGVVLGPNSTVETAELFLAIDSSEPVFAQRSVAQISIASRVERSWIETLFRSRLKPTTLIIFDETTSSVQKLRAIALDDLPLEEAQISRPSADEALPVLIEACRERWALLVARSEGLAQLFQRLDFLKAQSPDDADLMADLTETRERVLEEACFGETRMSAIEAKPLAEITLRYLPPALARRLTSEDEAPEFIKVPSGSRIRVVYPSDQAPFIEVRIQEIFGWRASPKLARGRVPLVLHLLGPNYRPVQVTSDLQSFWSTGYLEVRKELRIRYPKHSWPLDPTDAVPEAKGRRRT